MTRKLSEADARARAEAAGFRPDTETPYPGSSEPWPGTWEACGHQASPLLSTIQAGNRCGYCANLKVLVGFNDLLSGFPQIAAEADGWDPATVVRHSAKRLPWKCRKGHRWSAVVSTRTRLGVGCRKCAAVKRGARRKLSDSEARQTAEKAGFVPDPNVPYPGARESWPGRWSECGHEGSPALMKIKAGQGCGHEECRSSAIAESLRMPDSEARRVANESGFEPNAGVPYPGARKGWPGRWIACGHEGSPQLSVLQRGAGCTRCSYLIRGENQLRPDAEARQLVRALGYEADPDVAFPGGKRRWAGRWAECGHSGAVKLEKLLAGEGCPKCAEYGYKRHEPGYLYLVERPGEQKIGITNEPDVRLANHRRKGWALLDLMGPISGETAAQREDHVKVWLRSDIGTLQGTTEAWSTASLEVASLDELLHRAGVLDFAASA